LNPIPQRRFGGEGRRWRRRLDTWRKGNVVLGCCLEEVRMIKTLPTGQTDFGVVLEKISNTVDQASWHGSIEERIDISWLDLQPPHQ